MTFDLFRPTEEHDELRAAVREVVEGKIAPHAAEVDAESRFPQEAHDALQATDFFAPHVPEQYGVVGAEELDTAIVIEELVRGCASSSLIRAVNQPRSMPIQLGGAAA